MDYGQNNQIENPNINFDFFTSGAGTNSENENTFDAEDNLDLTNPEISWNTQDGSRRIGSNAMQSSSEKANQTPEIATHKEAASVPSSREQAPALGQILPTMPPDEAVATAGEQPGAVAISVMDFSKDKVMNGDTLKDDAVNALQNEERELAASGDIAAFVDRIDNYRDQFQGRGQA